ncbi:MAG TPA: hypothetical protein VMB21_20825 [Candidatus Limnocylindria bacterium]|nr:hypothetical protein [Candidatus Limnocylindria bacterium]
MLLLFRIFLTSLFGWLLWRARHVATGSLEADVTNAGNFALSIVVGFLAALTWAPLLGEIVAGPMTGVLTDGSPAPDSTGLIRFIRRCEARGWHRLAVLLCFVEGVRHPSLPAAFVIGMNNAKPGSWPEMVFAREVFGFSNVANCLRAHDILKLRHDLDPGSHPVPAVTLALIAHMRVGRAEAPTLAVPAAPAGPPRTRNSKIRLFAAADRPKPDPQPPEPNP